MGVHPRTCQFPCGTSGRNRAPAGAQAKFVQRMRTTARRLADLIVSLLDYAAIESGKLDVRIEPVDPRALAEEIQQDLEPQARLKGLDLQFSVAEDLPPLETDPRLLRLVLVNLVGNAIRFTDGGTVIVSLGCGVDAHSFEVRDTGPGIPPRTTGASSIRSSSWSRSGTSTIPA